MPRTSQASGRSLALPLGAATERHRHGIVVHWTVRWVCTYSDWWRDESAIHARQFEVHGR